ncbi:MAG: HlyD family efflux transporter periplasmic adaptor subunit [Chloroflexota bacterium]
MKRHENLLRLLSITPLITLTLLTACGAPATAQEEVATPTPLPPAPELERPTYEVERGTIAEALERNGRVTPVDLNRLQFRRDGRVETLSVERGDTVEEGQVLAELQQDEARDELRQSENALAQAQRSLSDAQREREKSVQQANLSLENAEKALARLLPGGPDDPIREAQKTLEEAERTADDNKVTASEAKTEAEFQLVKDTEALIDAQDAYSDAKWDFDHVEKYGTNPDQPFVEDAEGIKRPNKLTDEEKEQYEDALTTAERALRDAERQIGLSQRNIDQLRGDEVEQVEVEDENVIEARRTLDELLTGEGNDELISAQNTVEEARLALEEAQIGSLDEQITSIENAQADVEKARKAVEDGQIIAPQSGEILSIAINEGDEVTAFESVIEVADPTNLEISAELSAQDMRLLEESAPVEISLLSRPDVIMPATIRRLPAPYGSGGSGAVQEEDQTTRFEISDLKGQELSPGAVAQIRMVLESKEDVLILPKEAVLAFEGNRFVIVQDGERERRVPVQIGIETETSYEILEDSEATTEGIEEGDTVVGR